MRIRVMYMAAECKLRDLLSQTLAAVESGRGEKRVFEAEITLNAEKLTLG